MKRVDTTNKRAYISAKERTKGVTGREKRKKERKEVTRKSTLPRLKRANEVEPDVIEQYLHRRGYVENGGERSASKKFTRVVKIFSRSRERKSSRIAFRSRQFHDLHSRATHWPPCRVESRNQSGCALSRSWEAGSATRHDATERHGHSFG